MFVRNIIQHKRRPKLQELATYTQQLANLLHAGMPLGEACVHLAILTEDQKLNLERRAQAAAFVAKHRIGRGVD